MELHIEETKSATEEFQSVNEELQSSNEELETAKEEMQSINEELQTVNAELQSKNDALTGLNSDLQNLMDSTEIATVFLDQDLRIRNFTPAIAKIFPLREGDRGRPLSQIVSQLIDADLDADVTQVQRTLATVEREVQIKQDDATLTLLMRIRPYRTVDNRIDGVVVTFVDINAITLATAELARFAALARSSGDAIVGLSLDGVVNTWSPGAEHLLGYTSAEMIGRNISTPCTTWKRRRATRYLAAYTPRRGDCALRYRAPAQGRPPRARGYQSCADPVAAQGANRHLRDIARHQRA